MLNFKSATDAELEIEIQVLILELIAQGSLSIEGIIQMLLQLPEFQELCRREDKVCHAPLLAPN